MSDTGREGLKTIPTLVDPDSLSPGDFGSYDQYRAAYDKAKAVLAYLGRIEEIEKTGGFKNLITDLIIDALPTSQENMRMAQADFDKNMQTLRETTDLLGGGGAVTVRPAEGHELEVWRWGGSGYSERHEVGRMIAAEEEFVGKSFRWVESELVAFLYSSSIAGDTRSEWVKLMSTDGEMNFEIADVQLPLPAVLAEDTTV